MIYLLLILFAFQVNAKQDDKIMSSSTNSSELTYDIKLFFPFSVIHQYRLDEETEVERIYEDGTPYKYTKRLTWYVTMVAPVIKGKDDEKQVFVTIDSLDYEFQDSKYDVKYYNTMPETPPGQVWDFEKTFFLNAKEFDLFYDYYNKPYKIESERLEEDRFIISQYTEKSQDFRAKLLEKRYADKELIHIADPVKNLLPANTVAKDSSWNLDFTFDIDFVTFNNTTSATLNRVLDNHFYIKMKTDTLYCVDTEMLLDNIKKVGKIESGIASGEAELKISSKGHLKYLNTKFDAEIYGIVDNVKFIERKKTIVKWDLVGMWRQ